jgi:hypothetical protein
MESSAKKRDAGSALVLGVLLALGLTLAGHFIGNGLFQARATQRYVTVKGLSEREVPADLAIWPIVFTVSADDLGGLQQEVDASAAKITDFLSTDFDSAEFDLSVPRITDYNLQTFAPGSRPPQRYSAETTMTLRTREIDAAKRSMQRSGDLVKAGVALIRSYEYQTSFLFTGLETIKPEMIAEATRDARRAAEQFAEDSGSRVGAIRNAQQGYFSVEDRDRFSPDFKKVRVVTTVQYFLVDE